MFHELGHAVAARRRLGGAARVSIGNAGKLETIRLGEITVSLNALGHPGRRAGFAAFEASRATARDVVLIALAGPAASLVGLGFTAWALAVSQGIGVLRNLLRAAAAARLVTLLNVIPSELQE